MKFSAKVWILTIMFTLTVFSSNVYASENWISTGKYAYYILQDNETTRYLKWTIVDVYSDKFMVELQISYGSGLEKHAKQLKFNVTFSDGHPLIWLPSSILNGKTIEDIETPLGIVTCYRVQFGETTLWYEKNTHILVRAVDVFDPESGVRGKLTLNETNVFTTLSMYYPVVIGLIIIGAVGIASTIYCIKAKPFEKLKPPVKRPPIIPEIPTPKPSRPLKPLKPKVKVKREVKVERPRVEPIELEKCPRCGNPLIYFSHRKEYFCPVCNVSYPREKIKK
ncbi:hypothetical protein DRO02_03350 [archaeon]|nr:MAG: hypothetical protein DRO21_04280 [archaeon]RLG64850.1 MAG: hypothetical protein DRO02_03350 [archaeon]HDM23413.1 hypothetical protein [Candidatus Bathyarchaeota archaeon]